MSMKLVRRLVCALGVALAHPATAQEIAITIDDLPYVLMSRTSPAQGLEQVRNITDALAAYDITATGFAVGVQITSKTAPALTAFANAGHAIGNHSWSHPDYGTLTSEEFETETRRAHAALAAWLSKDQFYRFPYLREGESEIAKTAATKILTDLGYRNAPITIDNDEWRFNADYLDAVKAGDLQKAKGVAKAYLAHMKERTAHFQALAYTALGRDVAHILLLHMNQINADYLPELLEWYASEGWKFITLPEALQDPLYSLPDLYAGPRGLSQIERIMGSKSE